MNKHLFLFTERQHKKLIEEMKQESRLPVGLEDKVETVLDNYKLIIHNLLEIINNKN